MASNYQPGLRVSEYVLEVCVGRGAFGEVWRARHHVWDKERVAIKLPAEADYVRQLLREGLVAHGLRHPNVVGVKGFDPYAEIPYLVMDFVDGPSLAKVVADHPKGAPLPVIFTLLRGMLRAVRAAHDARVLHRDLKPGNVLLDLGVRPLSALTIDDVKVSDFGLGSLAIDATRSLAHSASLERDNHLVGTLAYMAPELRDGKRPADARTDLYAIGVILFELLTGERPAGAESPSYLRPDAPRELDDLFQKLYARHERRYPSAAEALATLEREDLLLTPAPPARPPSPRAGRPGVVTSCAACGARLQNDDQFCTQCGAQVVEQVRRCGACGSFPAPDDQYCIHCGVELGGAAH